MSFLSSTFLFGIMIISVCAILGWWSRRTGFAYTQPDRQMHVQYSRPGVHTSISSNTAASEMSTLG